MAKVLVISDTQAPFHHPDTLEFLEHVYYKYKCNAVVHIGDEIDNKFLKYASINDPHTAKEQHEIALSFMKGLYKIFPNVKVCNSNHVSERLAAQAEAANIPEFYLKSQHEYLEAPKGWGWADEWVIDGVKYEHGHKYGGQKPHEKAVECNFMSSVIGHHPLLKVSYVNRNDKLFFGMCVGMMVVNLNNARMGYGMKYSKRYATKPPLGCGVVLNGNQAIIEPFYG